MKHKDFEIFLEEIIEKIRGVLSSKSADYSDNILDDKLFNFKEAGRIDNITPIEALRGMWLKHRTSINQGLDELMCEEKCRPWEWWVEKSIDNINYNILLLALIEELKNEGKRL
jgi:hypothetical protein